MVLLKNDGVLPVAEPPKRIAVIGWHAGTIRSFFGGCTHLSMAEGMKGDIATMAGVTPEGQVKRKDMPRYPDTFVTSEEPFAEDYEALAKSLYPEVRTLYEAIRDAFPKSEVVYAYGYDFIGTEERRFRKALALAKTCDLTVLTLGGLRLRPACVWSGSRGCPRPGGKRAGSLGRRLGPLSRLGRRRRGL